MSRRDQARDSAGAEKRHQAFELRKAGATYREIAAALDVSLARAHQYVHEVLDGLAAETREEAKVVREIELVRLDHMQRELWRQGPGTPQITDRLLRIMERRSKLLGLDAPTKLEHMLDPSAVQSVLGFALSGGIAMNSDTVDFICALVVEILAGRERIENLEAKVREYAAERQSLYVNDFEQRARTELTSGEQAA